MKPLDGFPDALTVQDMARLFDVSVKTIYGRHERGELTFALIRPRIGPLMFSRAKLQEWADGKLRGLTPHQLRRAG